MTLDEEKIAIHDVFGICPCCVIPCCNYCIVQVIWTVSGSASRLTSGGTRIENLDFDWSFDMTFNRDDDRNAPADPKTFRVSEAPDLEECELLNNGGVQQGTLDGSYLYTDVTLGVENDREEADLQGVISDMHIRLDCDNASWPYAGTTHPTTGLYVPTSTVSVYADGIFQPSGNPTLGAPNSMPEDWRGLFGINVKQFNNVAEIGGVGTETVTVTESSVTGWDSGSLSDVITINVTRCEDV